MVASVAQNPTQGMAANTARTPGASDSKGPSALSRMMEKNMDTQYNTFMKMFVAQVKNQSIDNPMSTHEMTQSVMSFLNASESMQTNKLLKQGNDMKVKEQVSTARGYLNKEIEYDGDVIGFDGATPQKIQFQVPANQEKVTLRIFDTTNPNNVKEVSVDLKPGKKFIIWDGSMDGTEGKAAAGQYVVNVVGVNKAKEETLISTVLQGRVEAIHYEEDEHEHLLVVNGIPVAMSDVVSERKIQSTDFSELNKKLDSQIRQYEDLNKLLRKKFDMEEPVLEDGMPDLEPVVQPIVQTGLPINGEQVISEGANLQPENLGNWVP